MLRTTSSSFLFSEWTSPPPGQTHCLKEPDQALRGPRHTLSSSTLSLTLPLPDLQFSLPLDAHTHTDCSPHPTLSHPHGSSPGLHLWRPVCSLTVCTLQSTGGDSVGIVPAHHDPQTLSLPGEARVLLWETEAPEKSKRRRGLPQGGRRQTSRGCSRRHPAHVCSPRPLRGDPQPVYRGETLIRAHHAPRGFSVSTSSVQVTARPEASTEPSQSVPRPPNRCTIVWKHGSAWEKVSFP